MKYDFGNQHNLPLSWEPLTKVASLDLCRLFSPVLRVLRANTHWYLTEKRVRRAETGGAKMMAGLLSKAPSFLFEGALLEHVHECAVTLPHLPGFGDEQFFKKVYCVFIGHARDIIAYSAAQ